MGQEEILLKVQGLQVEIKKGKNRLFPVSHVDLEVPERTVTALVGESGCGKSMTAKAIMGLFPKGCQISEGSIVFKDEKISSFSEKELRRITGKRISMIFQDPMTSLNPTIRIGKQVEEVLLLHTDLKKAERKRKVVEMLRDVGIPDPEERYQAFPHQLSGGLRQRVVIAMAMICEPELLIADEPTTALDVTIENQILKLMYRLKEEKRTSILMITHNLGIVSEFCEYVNVMYLGEIVETAESECLFIQPLHPYTKGLIACIPSEKKGVQKLENIKGTVPDLMNIPKGCRFCDRCPEAEERCRTEHPELIDAGHGHKVRCFKYQQGGEKRCRKKD